MDDLTTRKMAKEAETMLHATKGPMEDMGAAIKDLKTEALNAALSRILGVPDIDAIDCGHGTHWAGYVIGNMCSKEIPVEVVHRVLHAVATVGWKDQYDICGYDDTGDQLDAIPSGCQVEHRYSANDLYRWARFFRVAVNEIAFAIEDHFDDPKQHPTAELIRRAVSAVDFFIDTLHPIYARTLGS